MRTLAGGTAAAAAVLALSCAPARTAATGATPPPQESAAPIVVSAASGEGLNDLNSLTFGCPRAGLNAAAREAAKAPSQGTYQFSYFRIVSDSHHASYEVHFKSNYVGEPDLKYCVAVYCQQGWDPRNTKITIQAMSDMPQRRSAGHDTGHAAACSGTAVPAQRRVRQ